MKRILYILITAVTIGTGLFSCEPLEDRDSLPAINYTEATLNHTEVLTDNTLTLTNNDKDVISYWSVVDNATKVELGHYNGNNAQAIIPFKGSYSVTYTAYTRGGIIATAPKTITVLKTDLSSITKDPRWGMLTNGAAGKTWVIKMANPIGFAGPAYLNTTVGDTGGDAWTYFPGSINEILWSGIEVKDWGEITFDLNEGYNVTVKQTSLTTGSTAQTTTKGTFTYTLSSDFKKDFLDFNGGTKMLYQNAYYTQQAPGFSFSRVRLVEITATSLKYAMLRDDGAQVIVSLIPKA
ncbi:hypothetical protein [Flavobacterium reichenbachii]|uniref:PKD domain-containing protein n=1 Tax=Flavobacterium reichenbachii TaxID=362418 RepID=A0A085ZJW7_9FLAO|nr:hypothetical protein [Flavobacterium reichenbachii]KFF04731.1 hypothetical protein IW19_03925 [Flavobacterium reichenbachii]OXB10367.1 hypothetical protein B0A68_22525 [Flavobacterium reichenbachii]